MPKSRRAPAPIRYVALIGDIVGSRTLAPKRRAELQNALGAWIEGLNRELDGDMAAPFTLTAGDEIQGLLRRPSAVVRVLQEMADRMFQLEYQPHALFGVGRGELTTGPIPRSPARSKSPALLDGPAFHHARDALEHVQDEGGWVRFVGFGKTPEDTVPDQVLDALFSLMGAIRDRWTVTQAGISYRMHKSSVDLASQRYVTQKLVASQIKVSPSVISESLKASRHFTLREGEEAARLYLESLPR